MSSDSGHLERRLYGAARNEDESEDPSEDDRAYYGWTLVERDGEATPSERDRYTQRPHFRPEESSVDEEESDVERLVAP